MLPKIFPFLWLHGEDKDVIESEIESIYNCNLRAFCVESRPHPDFCGELWWRDMDIVFKKAKSLGMSVWVLDDKQFPTGFANGMVLKHPELAPWRIAKRECDIRGLKRGRIRIDCKTDDRLLFAAAYGYRGEEPDYGSSKVLTESFENGFLFFDLPENQFFRIVTIWKTHAGGKKDRIDMLSPESVQLLIDAVYEPHYAHYKALFGETFAGFFSDEPGFCNEYIDDSLSHGGTIYDTRLGIEGMAYPISDEALQRLKEHPLYIDESDLIALWTIRNERDSEIRCAYMDIITDLYAEHFSGKIGGWCKRHGVRYIGHIIEDMNCHVHTGVGAGHYFKSQTGQDMAGIDIVLHQLEPGFGSFRHRAPIDGGYADPVFFAHTLPALACSEAHMDPRKAGNSVCEIFGAYGWGLDIGKMKQMLDMMLVGGINHFVPHVLSAAFPRWW